MRLQVHLSTAMLLFVLGSIAVGINIYPREISLATKNQDFSSMEGALEIDIVDIRLTSAQYGWPFTVRQKFEVQVPKRDKDGIFSLSEWRNLYSWHWMAFILNVAFAIIFLVIVGAISEITIKGFSRTPVADPLLATMVEDENDEEKPQQTKELKRR